MENDAQKEGLRQEPPAGEISTATVRSAQTFRDDQHDFYGLLDTLRLTKKKGGVRPRLVDSGVFDINQMEDLIKAGGDLYTSDRDRSSSVDLGILLKAARKSGTIVAFFLYGDPSEEGEEENLSWPSLSLLGKDGLIIHVSNREHPREMKNLVPVAVFCRQGRGRLVYYHHGALSLELIGLAKEGAWIHVSDRSVRSEEDSLLFQDIALACQAAGANVVIHVERIMPAEILRDAVKAGAFVLFKTLPRDFKSPLRPLEDEAGKKKLDFRAYFLFPTFFP